VEVRLTEPYGDFIQKLRVRLPGSTVFVESLPQFAEHIVPHLWKRDVHRREYGGTTLRDNLAQNEG